MADVVRELLGEGKNKANIDFSEYRDRFLKIIKYLLSYGNPDVESNTNDYGNDPFSVAINSVRGRSFQSFVLFIYRDGDSLTKEDKVKISEEVKNIYEEVLDKRKKPMRLCFCMDIICLHFIIAIKNRLMGWFLRFFRKTVINLICIWLLGKDIFLQIYTEIYLVSLRNYTKEQ